VKFRNVTSNWVGWSSVQGDDFPLWFFYPTQFTNYGNTPDKETILRRYRNNELGLMQLPTDCRVLKMMPLGENVVVYCDEAVFLLELNFPRVDDLPPTVGQRKLLSVGICDRGAAGGNEFQQAFIDQRGLLWRITADAETEPLGYTEFFENDLDQKYSIHYSDHEQEFFIGNENRAFVLDQNGLAEIGESPTFVVDRVTEKEGLVKDLNISDGNLVSAPTDFGDNGINTITSVAVGHRGGGDVSLALDFRYDPNNSWNRTAFQPLNREGIAYIRRAGTEFRAVLNATEPGSLEIDYIDFRYQLSDKRHQRGPRADAG
jgi:hypothetical protein